MAITASQVGTANTLEQFRVQFNNLQTDVSGLESGTISYTALSATTISVSELTVTSSLSAESFIFEGDTDTLYCFITEQLSPWFLMILLCKSHSSNSNYCSNLITRI